jgi:hypothetical protein
MLAEEYFFETVFTVKPRLLKLENPGLFDMVWPT